MTRKPRLEASQLRESQRADGRTVYRSSVKLGSDRPDILDRLRHWAAADPHRVLLTEPCGSTRRSLAYGMALALSGALRAVLVRRHALRPGDRLASLAPAGVDSLLLKLACLTGGFVHVALPPYPFQTGANSEAARAFLAAARPRLTVAPSGHPAVANQEALDLSGLVAAATDAGADSSSLEAAYAPSDWAAIFFTSGSTGVPKGVPVTRGMIASNQAAIATFWPFLAERPPVLVDWLPWHHVFGGLDNIFKMIWNGGSLHVDSAPSVASLPATMQLIERTAPTMHIGVPLGVKLLLDRMEADPAAAKAFTRNLEAIFFAGAGIDSTLWNRLVRFRDAYGAFEIVSGYGATEAASTICLSPAPLEQPGELGHPLPGHEICLAETDGRLELRVRGPNLAPGYLTPEGLAPLPLDDDGFYRTGDAAVIRTRADGQTVFAFDGRLAEDFKLSNGVKVQAGRLRAGLLAHCAPLIEDIVFAGENRDDLAALIFPAAPSAAAPGLPARIGHALALWNEAHRGLSTAIARFAIAAAPPDRSRGEVSDKGQIVRGRFLQNHRALFDALYAGESHAPKRLGAAETSGLSPDRETAPRVPPETPSADAP